LKRENNFNKPVTSLPSPGFSFGLHLLGQISVLTYFYVMKGSSFSIIYPDSQDQRQTDVCFNSSFKRIKQNIILYKMKFIIFGIQLKIQHGAGLGGEE